MNGTTFFAQRWAKIILILVVISIGARIIYVANNNQDKTSPDIDVSINNKLDSLDIQKQNRENLLRQVEIIKNTPPFPLNSSLEEIQARLIAFALWSKMSESSQSDTISRDIRNNKLTPALIKIQLRDFPLLRKAYANFAKQKLWENDIDVNVSGKGNTVLKLTGYHFSLNRNIKDTQDALIKMIIDLRYKQIRYDWSNYSDEYTYYDMGPPKDDHITSYYKIMQ